MLASVGSYVRTELCMKLSWNCSGHTPGGKGARQAHRAVHEALLERQRAPAHRPASVLGGGGGVAGQRAWEQIPPGAMELERSRALRAARWQGPAAALPACHLERSCRERSLGWVDSPTHARAGPAHYQTTYLVVSGIQGGADLGARLSKVSDERVRELGVGNEREGHR